MASIQWKYSYHSSLPGARMYYHGGSASGAIDQQLVHFVNDHLSRSRGVIVTGMKRMQTNSRNRVKARSRVDTGAMRRQVFTTLDSGTDIIKLRFGWRELEPYYAPFQESGTRRGIEPMMAVATAYEQAVADLQRLIHG